MGDSVYKDICVKWCVGCTYQQMYILNLILGLLQQAGREVDIVWDDC